mmetsp:Transcript_29835/g.70264  ORF Transcript_29835/g.70264 Transcript_29835/m.70264 type:complete len:288 (+) Transcript_29835:625-1488(+)
MERGKASFSVPESVSQQLLSQPLVLLRGWNLHEQHSAADFHRQPLHGGGRGRFGCEQDRHGQSVLVGLGQGLVEVGLSGLDPFDKAGELVLEKLPHVPQVALPVLVVHHVFFRAGSLAALLALGFEQPDGRGSPILAQQSGRPGTTLGVPVGNGDHAPYRCCQLLPFWLEKLAVSSPLSAYIHKHQMWIVHNVFLPIGRRECHDVGRKQILVLCGNQDGRSVRCSGGGDRENAQQQEDHCSSCGGASAKVPAATKWPQYQPRGCCHQYLYPHCDPPSCCCCCCSRSR